MNTNELARAVPIGHNVAKTTTIQRESIKLDESLIQKNLSDLKVGEECWAVPWAMRIDSFGLCYLDGGFTAYEEKGGTVEMSACRTRDGYYVTLPKTYKFAKQQIRDYSKMIPVMGYKVNQK